MRFSSQIGSVALVVLSISCKTRDRMQSNLKDEQMTEVVVESEKCAKLDFPDRFNIKMENQTFNRRFKITDNTPDGDFSTLGFFQGLRKRLPFNPKFQLFGQASGEQSGPAMAEISSLSAWKLFETKITIKDCLGDLLGSIKPNLRKNLGKKPSMTKSKFYRILDKDGETIAEIERLEGPPDFDVDRYSNVGSAMFLVFRMSSSLEKPSIVAYRPFETFLNSRDTWSFEYKDSESKVQVPPLISMALPVFLSDKRIARKLKKGEKS